MTVEHSGGGDPERTLALLWRDRAAGRTDGRPPRGRRPKLTVDQIVRAALAVADREGLASMSMVRVADEAGAGTMSLYTYVPGKAELIDLMVDAVLTERDLPGPGDQRPEGWLEQIELYAERTRAAYRRHPWLREISTVRPPLGPGLMAQQEYLLSALSGIGLSPRQITAAAGTIVTFVHAAAAAEAEYEQLERTGESAADWWAARGSFWEDYFDVTRHPTIARLWREGGFDAGTKGANAEAYEFGLRRLLSGIQAAVEQARDEPARP
ncbi:TetR/AcrR family transcriptional regulator [Actinoallomurus iriomotensis]|uniref:TetR family transcriptional regulator n=1 Tax=Actinoallomurus iriomotensis TaxID=478107 RepID=A0A9W6RJQ8_9ACTN|nr:TetR/AcrR family transcriptional regulator [Actinoallomurus iriomotensis]GLY77251.1 TetR family transcriptional regulator [Actinoallomurus iriomotensis]